MCAEMHKVLIFFLLCDFCLWGVDKMFCNIQQFYTPLLFCFVFSIHNGRPWCEEFGGRSVLYSLCWGKLHWFPVSRFMLFVQGVPLLDFLFHFPFWKVTYVTAPRLLSIIIYHNLEMNSKYRLNIFQLSVNDNLEKNLRQFQVHFLNWWQVLTLTQRNIQIM